MAIISETSQLYFYRRLYGGQGMLQSVTLYKRNDDQAQGTVTTYTLFRVRWSMIFKTGEPLQGEMLSSHSRRLHIPVTELRRVGVHYLNPLDRFKDRDGRVWQPEAPTMITDKLLETHWCCDCLLVEGESLHG